MTRVPARQTSFAAGISVEDFGASPSASASVNTAAFNAAIASLPLSPAPGGGIIYLPGNNYNVTVSEIWTGGRLIYWEGPARINNAILRPIPGNHWILDPVAQRRILYRADAPQADAGQLEVRTVHNIAGGTTGTVAFALRADQTVGPLNGNNGTRPDFWAVTGIVNQQSQSANAVALSGVCFTTSPGPLWAIHGNCNSSVVPTTYAHRGAEINIAANGEDANGLRWIVDVVGLSQSGTYSGNDSIQYGIVVTAAQADINYGVYVRDQDADFAAGGHIREAAFMAVTEGELFRGIGLGREGVVKIGSQLNTGQIANMLFPGNNNAGQQVFYGQITSAIVSNVDNAERGAITLRVMNNGAALDVLQVSGDQFRLNLGSGLQTVRAEANNSGGSGRRMLTVPNG